MLIFNAFVQAELELFCAQGVANFTSFSTGAPTENTNSLSLKGVARHDSPPWREDDKDGHYVFAVGDNLTSRCNYLFPPLVNLEYIVTIMYTTHNFL